MESFTATACLRPVSFLKSASSARLRVPWPASQPESKTSATAASSASSIDGRVSGTGEGNGGQAAGNVAGAGAAVVSGLSGRGQPPAGGQWKS